MSVTIFPAAEKIFLAAKYIPRGRENIPAAKYIPRGRKNIPRGKKYSPWPRKYSPRPRKYSPRQKFFFSMSLPGFRRIGILDGRLEFNTICVLFQGSEIIVSDHFVGCWAISAIAVGAIWQCGLHRSANLSGIKSYYWSLYSIRYRFSRLSYLFVEILVSSHYSDMSVTASQIPQQTTVCWAACFG